MGDWQLFESVQQFSMDGYDPASPSRLMTITPDASANTKGSWTEIVTASTFNASAITVYVQSARGTGDYLFDIGIGASGSEQVLFSNLSVSLGCPSCEESFSFALRLPVAIPSGTRISARAQGTNTTSYRKVRLGIGLDSSNASSGGNLITIGANTTDSGGVEIDPGGVADTKGSWIEISSATSEDIKKVFFCFGNKENTSFRNGRWKIDIGIGAAASEQVIIPDIPMIADTQGSLALLPNPSLMYNIYIPAGTRIAVRAACDDTGATDRLFDIIMYGII